MRSGESAGLLGGVPSLALLCPFPLEAKSDFFRLYEKEYRCVRASPLGIACLTVLGLCVSIPPPVFVREVSLTPTVESSTREKLLRLPINPHSFVDVLLFKPGPRLTGWRGIGATFIIPNHKTPQACVECSSIFD